MNDFERIYTVIKTQYTCGVPYYNYGKCVYDELSQNYIQEGKLDLLKSEGYSNVPLNDIPIACNQPTNTIIMCSPPVLEIQKPDPGFRLKFQNSAYLDENLILKSPSDYSNTLFIYENTGLNTCLKSVISGKYVSYDSLDNIIWSDTCSEYNNILYESNKLKFISRNLCINPTRYYTSIPNNEKLRLSSCSLNIFVEEETPDMPLVIFAEISFISPISLVENPVPATMGNVIPTKYNVIVPNTPPSSVRTKVKNSNVSALLLVMNYYQIINRTISTVYITTDKGKTWNALPVSDDKSIRDISMSQDGKYILIIDEKNFYYSSDFGTTFTSKVVDDRFYTSNYSLNWRGEREVVMSLDGRVQVACIRRISVRINYSDTFISIIHVSYDYGKTFIKSVLSYWFTDLILSKTGDILMITIYDGTTRKNSTTYLNNNSLYTFDLIIDLPRAFQISNDSKNIYVLLQKALYYSNDYGLTWKTNDLSSLFTKLSSLGIDIRSSNFDNLMTISLSGKYIFIVLKRLSQGGLIGYSKDYGENFELFQTEDNILNNTLIDWQDIDILPDGSQLILSDKKMVYFLKTNEPPDVLTIENKQKIISPSNEFKYLYKTNITYNRVLKSGRDIFIIDNNRVSFYEGNIINLSNVPITISSICMTNKGTFYTIDNKIFDLNNKEVFSTSSNFVHITSNKQGNLFLALSTQIHISRDGFIWNTVNLQPRKWVMGYISSELNMYNAYTLSCIEEYGNIFVSRDSGLRWTANKEQNSYFWNSISMSDNGMVQIATCRENLPLVSYDYGLTFNSIKFDYNLKDPSGNYIREFVDCSVSEDGFDFIAVCKNGQIIYSNKNTDWKIYGQYNFNRTELDLTDNYFIVNNTLYNSQFDFLTFRLNTTLWYNISPSFLTPFTNNVTNAFESYSTSMTYNFILPYNTTLAYTGRSKTYNADKKIDINAEYIEFGFPVNMMLKIDKFIINSGVKQGTVTNKFNNIKNLRIMGSNDSRNYYEILNVTDNSTPFDLSKLVFVTRNNKYYNSFRIVLDGVNNAGVVSYLSGINFEGVMNVNCALENIVSNDWKKISFKTGNMLVARDKLYLGTKPNMIFSEFSFMPLSDIVYSSNTTLTTDIFCENLTINSAVVLSTNGFRIFCRSKLINNGSIQNNGINGSGGLGGAINDTLQRPLGMGGNGGNGSTNSTVRALNGVSRNFCIVNAFGGNGGQRTTLRGIGGTCTVIANQNALFNPFNAIVGKDASGNMIQGGAGGGGGEKGTNTSNGGGGGSGGGVIMICANEIINNGFIRVNGGAGEGFTQYSSTTLTGASSGGGGGGGTVIIVTSSLTNLTNRIQGIQVAGGNSWFGEINTSSSSLSGGNGTRGNPGRIIIVRV
jgi:hypothetical protein